MNRFLLFIGIFLFAILETSGQSSANGNNPISQSERPLSEKEARNKRTALASIEAIAKGNVDEALKEADLNIVNIGNGVIPPVKGLERVRAGLKMFSTALPIEKVEDIFALAEGDWVMVWGRWSGSWKGDMMGQTATGKPFTKRDIEIFKFNEEGKMIEHHSVQSFLEIATQVGLKLPEKKLAQ